MKLGHVNNVHMYQWEHCDCASLDFVSCVNLHIKLWIYLHRVHNAYIHPKCRHTVDMEYIRVYYINNV